MDNYEVVGELWMILNTKPSEPGLVYTFGVHTWGGHFPLAPRHIRESAGLAAIQNCPPVVSAPYTLEDVDPNGNWFPYDKREDWQHTDRGQIFGESGPEHVLFCFSGKDERRIVTRGACMEGNRAQACKFARRCKYVRATCENNARRSR